MPVPEADLNFRALRWNSNRFEVVRSERSLLLVVDRMEFLGEPPRTIRLLFSEPRAEWAMLWDERANQWRPHPDPATPGGETIIEAFVKGSRTGLLFSFAGNHKLGWSRWGFTASGVREC